MGKKYGKQDNTRDTFIEQYVCEVLLHFTTHSLLFTRYLIFSRKKHVVKEAIKYLGLWPHTCDFSVNHSGSHKLQSGSIKGIALSLKGPGINEAIRDVHNFC